MIGHKVGTLTILTDPIIVPGKGKVVDCSCSCGTKLKEVNFSQIKHSRKKILFQKLS